MQAVGAADKLLDECSKMAKAAGSTADAKQTTALKEMQSAMEDVKEPLQSAFAGCCAIGLA